MANILIEQIINSYYIRYNRLVPIINEAFVGSNATKLHLYIDLYSVLKPLYNQEYDIKDYSTVTSCLINMCAHYREFFKKAYQTDTVIYLVYSKNNCIVNKQFYKDYNVKNEFKFNSNKLIQDMIQFNVNLLNIICPYLPDIHFVQGTFESGVLIYDLICRAESMGVHDPHVIITKDAYNYQLVAMNDNIIILRPKKSNQVDESFYISRLNLLHYYLQSRECKTGYEYTGRLMPGLLSLIMTLSSVKERNIKTLSNISTALKLVDKAIVEYKLMNGYNSDPMIIWNGIDNTKLNISDKSFEFRFKAIDIQSQHSIFMTTPECKSIQLLNLDDPQAINQINNQYFINNPIDVLRL